MLCKHWPAKPVVVTDGERPYFKKGLIYVPLYSFDRKFELTAAPHVAIERAHAVLKFLGAEILALPGK